MTRVLSTTILVIELVVFLALLAMVLGRRLPHRWRGTVAAFALIAGVNLGQSLLVPTEGAIPLFSLDRLMHAAEVVALAVAAIVFRRDISRPDRLLDRAEEESSLAIDLHEAPAIVFATNRDGMVRRVNRVAAETLGIDPDKLIGREAFSLVPPGPERDRARSSFLKFVGSAGAVAAECEYQLQTPEGLKLMHWRRTAQLDEKGAVVGVISYGEDVSERRKVEQRLAAESYLLDSVFDAVTVWGEHGKNLYNNRAMYTMLGMNESELMALGPMGWMAPESRAIVAHMERTELTGDDLIEVMALRKDGSRVPLELRSQRIEFEGQSAIMSVGRDISARRHAQQLMMQMAYTDPLTGLPNQRTINDCIANALMRRRVSGEPTAVFFVDVDNLKNVNDTLGHEAGDRLIRMIGHRLRDALGDQDILGRVGGDEFVVVSPGTSSAEEYEEIGQRLLEAMAEPLHLDGHHIRMTSSIGVAECQAGLEADEVVARADRAMYAAKRNGGGSVRLHTPELDEEFLERFTLRNDLAVALTQDEFIVEYQPVVCAHTGLAVAAEALLRWNHPTRGLLPPGTFIDLAELNGSIREIGAWVLSEACEALRYWREQGLMIEHVAVNVSPVQLRTPGFADDVMAILRKHGVDAHSLELEVTETQMMDDADGIEAVFSRLSEYDLRLALDDFGTGHSSLERLLRLPIRTLKLDKTFVNHLCEKSTAHPIIDSVLVLAHQLGLDVIAEGVETPAQADYLRKVGVAKLQGFALAMPMGVVKFAEACSAGALGIAGQWLKVDSPPKRVRQRRSLGCDSCDVREGCRLRSGTRHAHLQDGACALSHAGDTA